MYVSINSLIQLHSMHVVWIYLIWAFFGSIAFENIRQRDITQ